MGSSHGEQEKEKEEEDKLEKLKKRRKKKKLNVLTMFEQLTHSLLVHTILNSETVWMHK